VALPKAVSNHDPMLIGDVGLATRNMWWARLGTPRSATSKPPLTTVAASDAHCIERARLGFDARSAPAARSALPAARPPVKKYAGISHVQTGSLSTGRS
jgi:hypothetical protein